MHKSTIGILALVAALAFETWTLLRVAAEVSHSVTFVCVN
jgi:hypothetical protein